MAEHKRPASELPGARRARGWFSPLIRRVLAVNVIALAILGGGILYLDQFRENLIDRRLQNLEIEAEIIAGAIGESAAEEADIDTIDLEDARQIIARLVGPTNTRARLFGLDGRLLADSRVLDIASSVQVTELPPPDVPVDIEQSIVDWINDSLDKLAYNDELEFYTERPGQEASDYGEVVLALAGDPANRIRNAEDRSLVITVAIPIQRFRRVLGALLLSTDTSDIQDIVSAERMTILKVFGLSIVVTLLLSFFLASTIARPIQRLARAADKVTGGIGRAGTLPDYPDRRDEIGDLADSLKQMTRTLYRQLDAVESFAADVAHELKNPLSSLRSAVETIQRSDDPEVRAKLLGIVAEDVKRLNRLISDISNASRLDAELSRSEMDSVDLKALIETLIDAYRATGKTDLHTIRLEANTGEEFTVTALELQIGQVIRNLIDNAMSFSPEGGEVLVTLSRDDKCATITVEDEGPGLPEGAAEKIFQRFYSERPKGEVFGSHSGLGLSICRQIVEAHGGRISAENRTAAEGDTAEVEEKIAGARFTVELPL